MQSKRWWVGAAAAIAVLFALLLAPIDLGATRLANAIENAAHGPLFAALAIGILLSLRKLLPRVPPLSTYVIAWVIAIAFGVATEAAQMLTGSRLASLRDLLGDALGAGAGLSAFLAFDPKLRVAAIVKAISISLAAIAMATVFKPVLNASLELHQRQAQLPALLNWDTPWGYRLLAAYDADGMTASVPVEWRRHEGERAFFVYPFAPHANTEASRPSWPGVSLDEPWPKWGEYRALRVDIVNPNDSELSLTLRINDWAHNHAYDDRFNRTLRIAPRRREEIVIPMTGIAAAPAGRSMDMSAIAKVILFQEGREGALPFYLCGMQLIR